MSRAQPHTESLPAKPPETSHHAHGRANMARPTLRRLRKEALNCIGSKDTACLDACPVDCIHPKKNTSYDDDRPGFNEVPQLYIDPVECIDCSACVPVCPVSAPFSPWTTCPKNGSTTRNSTPAMSRAANLRRKSLRNTPPSDHATGESPFGL